MESQYHKERIRESNDSEIKRDGDYVLYWMQRSQRAEWNMALELAIEQASKLDLGVVVAFVLIPDYPDATLRHYKFMLDGLKKTAEKIQKRDIKFLLQIGEPVDVIAQLAERAALLVCDRGYLRHIRSWRADLAGKVDCKMIEVEDNVVIPVEMASDKEEYAARTIRKKIEKQIDTFREEIKEQKPAESTLSRSMDSEDVGDIEGLIEKLKPKQNPGAVDFLKGGTDEAKKNFKAFLDKAYHDYDADRQKPHLDHVSYMSPYLHFGQISPLYILNEMKGRRGENRDSYLEELIVRRELAINFVYYNENYDSLKAIPEWASESLEKHKDDKREKVYTKSELENGETDDPYWNKAMEQMRDHGYLHNHMRMYWGKQILLYTNTPQYAYKVAIALNNKYFLDGRDPNSYANIAWLFGNHDRGWGEREVFGKVRSMTKGGLERKIDTEAWLAK